MKKFRVLFNSLLMAILGVFGITSCIAPVMYGPAMPEDFLEVDGEVTNEEGEPLQSIQVVLNTSRITLNDTIYTNASGEFERDYVFPQEGNDTLLLEVNDTANVYTSEKLEIPFTSMTKERESQWGTEYSVDVKVQLKKK